MYKKTNGKHMNKTEFGIVEYFAIILCFLVGTAMVIVMLNNSKDGNRSDDVSDENYDLIELNSSEEQFESHISHDDVSEDSIPYITVEIESSLINIGDLILVNRANPYIFPESANLVKVYDYKNDKYKLGSGNEKLFERTVIAANSFLGDFYDITGLTNVTMINAYISKDEQQKKYESYIKSTTPENAQKWGVKAGASDHHTALSFNLMLYPSVGKIGEGEYSWITENAYRYGFILRYPEEKGEITSVLDNNHFRYVGVPHAEYMYKNNLALEEYIAMLEKTTYNSPLNFESGNKEYIIYYSPADSSSSITEIKVPEGYECSYSGDNVSGFIITASLK